MPTLNWLPSLLQSGLGNLAAYLAAHVLLCLLPAFFINGGLTALVPKEAITRYLEPQAKKCVSYPAALGGFVLAVCSCTILPIFAGIYKKGAGLGPAITFLFVGPAINILALIHWRRARHGYRHRATDPVCRLWHRYRLNHGTHLSQGCRSIDERKRKCILSRRQDRVKRLVVHAFAAGHFDRGHIAVGPVHR